MSSQVPGASFLEAEVVRNYIYRPPYPDGVFERLLEIAPARDRLLDIGCGPGKISRALAAHFNAVTAVDPSSEMIALGRSLPQGDIENIEWIVAGAEDFETSQRFDLTVAANSLHWMDHPRLFAHLGAHTRSGHVMARLAGDAPHEPDWQSDWVAFLKKWIPKLTGGPYDPEAKATENAGWRNYLDIAGCQTFISEPFTQSLEDFIKCQHSRETFAPTRLGSRLSTFDMELAEMLGPYTHENKLTFRVSTRLEWGTIKNG